MVLTGVLINSGAIIAGGLAGTFVRKGFPDKLNIRLTQGLGLCVLLVGVQGILSGEKLLVDVLSIVIGVLIGEVLDFDRALTRLAEFLQSRLIRSSDSGSFSEAFTSASLFVCVGAMAIVGSLQSGLTGSHETLITKALIDGIVAIVMASAMGVGVCFAGFAVLLYESVLVLSAHAVAGLLGAAVISEITCVGSLLIIATALNILKITNIKVVNFILAPFLPILLCRFF